MSGQPTEPQPPGRAAGAPAWQELSREAARRRAAPGAPEPLRELLRCEVGGIACAFPLERVREIVRPRALTPLPRSPAWLLGVVALRGEIVQVVDLRQRLGARADAPARPDARSARIVVVQGAAGDAQALSGVRVDAVRAVMRIRPGDVRPSNDNRSRRVEALCSDGDGFVSILDVDGVLKRDDDD